jgi:hypothetical protein
VSRVLSLSPHAGRGPGRGASVEKTRTKFSYCLA